MADAVLQSSHFYDIFSLLRSQRGLSLALRPDGSEGSSGHANRGREVRHDLAGRLVEERRPAEILNHKNDKEINFMSFYPPTIWTPKLTTLPHKIRVELSMSCRTH